MAGEPTDDALHLAERFDAIMALCDQPMIVVTAADRDERAGCLVGFHVQCSIEPRRYAIWISTANATSDVARRATHFAVHFLTDGDHDLAELFGGTTGDDHDKFAECQWTPGPDGVPVLDRCPAHIVGRRVSFVDDGGDHVCIVIAPVDVGTPTGRPPLRLSGASDIEPGHEAG